MTYDMTPGPPPPSRRPSGDVLLSRADLTAAMHELDSLRGAHRLELAARLRAARAYGTASNDDDHLAVLEDVAVERIKIAQLERLIASATVVDVDAGDGDVAGLGSVVRVRDRGGRETDYELVGRLTANAARAQVTPASPVGEALMGARGGDVVSVALPNGSARTLTVVAVRRAGPDGGARA
jgi:transcription elongation factor GreA